MTVYIDHALIRSRGYRWCHLLSDASFEELHAFAGRLGLSRKRFHGDHYDVLESERDQAVYLGAKSIERRDLTELIPRLRERGLRLRPSERAARPSHL